MCSATMPFNRSLLFTALLFLSSIIAQSAESVSLGETTFENSGSPEAQQDFLNGLLYLHNFEYGDAAESFRRAQEIDPDFAMAYWGEAMTYNHPLWEQQAKQEAISCLRRLGRTPEERAAKAPTKREKMYLKSVEILYGLDPVSKGLPKSACDDMYRVGIEQFSRQYPDDLDLAAFHGLAILGSAHEGRDYRTYMQAAAVLMPVWQANPNHPGGAHYLIHSFDDPVHAPLGLPMARAYSEIAPSAAHAQHMTSHIFLALGMWDDLVKANERSCAIRDAGLAEEGQRPSVSSHDKYWLLYGYLQQDEIEKARAVLEKAYARLNDTPRSDEWDYFVAMLARYTIDAEDWDAPAKYSVPADHHAAKYPNYVFARGLAAWHQDELDALAEARGTLLPGGGRADVRVSDAQVEVLKMQLEALRLYSSERSEEAYAILRQAMEIESSLPSSYGPPDIAKPTAELLGELYLRDRKMEEAVNLFNWQLQRTPGRIQTLNGIERAFPTKYRTVRSGRP